MGGGVRAARQRVQCALPIQLTTLPCSASQIPFFIAAMPSSSHSQSVTGWLTKQARAARISAWQVGWLYISRQAAGQAEAARHLSSVAREQSVSQGEAAGAAAGAGAGVAAGAGAAEACGAATADLLTALASLRPSQPLARPSASAPNISSSRTFDIAAH